MLKIPVHRVLAILILFVCMTSCSTAEVSDTPPPDLKPAAAALIVPQVNVRWPELAASELCPPEGIQPEIEFCVLNDGTEVGAVPQEAYVLLPSGLAPGSLAAVLGSLPEGKWGFPEPVAVSGLPGAQGELQGLALSHTSVIPGAAPLNMIFLCLPIPGGCRQGLLLTHPSEPDESSQGLWIGPPDLTGASQVMGIIMEDKPGEDGSKGIIVVDSMPTGGEEGIIVVDSMPAGGEEGIIVVDSMPTGGEEGIIVVDSMPVGDWNARGIIVVDSMPGPGESEEGIIVVDSMPSGANISHVMGIIMEDKPGDDGSKGIIIVKSLPGPDGSAEGIIVVNGMPAADGSAEGIIVVNGMPAADGSPEGIVWGGMPSGFDPEGMMAMMGEGGVGPGVKFMAKLNLSELGVLELLAPGEQTCIFLHFSLNTGSSGDDYFIDSFFDVFTDLTVSMPSTDDSSVPELRRFPAPTPPYALCTPTPTPTTLSIPPTPTPRLVIPPTPTIRTGNPTATPGRSAPTATPISRD